MVGLTTTLLAIVALAILVLTGIVLTWLSLQEGHAPEPYRPTDEDGPD